MKNLNNGVVVFPNMVIITVDKFSSFYYFTGYNSVVRVPRGASRLKVIQVSTNPGDYDTNFLGKFAVLK